MRRRDERGSIFPMTLALMGGVLLVASMVIDVGGDRIVRRDMQSTADVVALDVVRQLNGNPAGSYTGFDASAPSATLLSTAKQESISRQHGIVVPDSVTIRLAVADTNSGAFLRWATATDIPNAVQVWTTGSSAFRFLSTTPRRSQLQRSAFAMIGPPLACISAGATFADVTPQGPLDTLLGKLVGVDRLTVLDPYGLASLDLETPLAQLAAQLHVGSVKDIVNAQVSAYDFVIAISNVLPHKGNSADVSLLDAIANGLPKTGTLNIGSILGLDTGGASAATLSVNTFSLLQAVIMVSNQNNFVDIPVTTNVTGLAKTTLQAKVVSPPKIACGPVGTTARSAQIQVKMTADVKALGGLVAAAQIDPLFMTVADGSGTITSISCSGSTKAISVSANTAAGTLGLNLFVDLLLNLTHLQVGVPDPGVKPNGAAIGSTSSQTLNFTFPPDDIPGGQTAGSAFGNLGLSSITPIKIDVTGVQVSGLLDSIVKPLLNIIDPLATAVLQPTFANLGVSVGTVRIQPVSQPSCNEAYLRG